MAFGTKTKNATPETTAEILAALDEVIKGYRADPDVAAAVKDHEELQRAASAAAAHEAGCREALRVAAWQIYEPGLLDDERRVEASLAKVNDELLPLHRRIEAGKKDRIPASQLDLQRRDRLHRSQLQLKQDLETIQSRLRTSTPRVLPGQVDAAPPTARSAYREACAALDAAVPASKAATEAMRDHVPVREAAKQQARARVIPLLLPIHAQLIREFAAALETARAKNAVMLQVHERLQGLFGSGVPIEHVGWPEFEAGRKIDVWYETLPGRAPHARLT